MRVETECSRPWLSLYQRRASTDTSDETATHDDTHTNARLPLDLWIHVLNRTDDSPSTPANLAATCRALWLLSKNADVWRNRCIRAYSLRGHEPTKPLLRHYCWDWLRMYVSRPRLRLDGVYFMAHSKLVLGVNEGRGMKEAADVDYHSPGGKWTTFYRFFRFFRDGTCAVYISSSHNPVTVRKLAAKVNAARPASLHQQLRGANWGTYTLVERRAEADGPPTHVVLEVDVPVASVDYPRMRGAIVHYQLLLTPHLKESRATNCDSRLVAHYLHNGDEKTKHFDVPSPTLHFVAFHATNEVARASWLSLAPMADRGNRWFVKALPESAG